MVGLALKLAMLAFEILYKELGYTIIQIFWNIIHSLEYRCILTTVDPNRGEKDKNEEPLKTLKR